MMKVQRLVAIIRWCMMIAAANLLRSVRGSKTGVHFSSFENSRSSTGKQKRI